MELRELEGLSFRCLEECGFCCTFTPEVAQHELARLRAKRPQLPVVRGAGRMHIAFQGGCGACTLLERRRCTEYADRPAHCRYFPFHVYFGRRTEVYVNRSCRGVEPSPGDVRQEFQRQVVAVANPRDIADHEALAAQVHEEFRRNCERAGLAADIDGAARDILTGPSLFDAGGLAAAEKAAGLDEGEAWQQALAPFALRDVVARPFFLDAKLRWLTFEAQAGFTCLEMDEAGRLKPFTALETPRPVPLENHEAAALDGVLRRLAGRDLFYGSAAFLVDGAGYRLTAPVAAGRRLVAMAADLHVRVAILEQLVGETLDIVDEAARFYDSAFLDAPTIGGWL